MGALAVVGFELLGRARQAGLRVVYHDGKLRIRGPRRAAAIAEELLTHKADVVAALLGGAIPFRVGDPVHTPAGPGRTWQVFVGRIGVVLDGEPTRVDFFRPDELQHC